MHPTDFTLAGALAALNEGAISAEELTRAHLAAVEALNPKLNAFITTTSEQALDAARASDARRPAPRHLRREARDPRVRRPPPPRAPL
jgi:aspartyl-tRNA(Asn)/glutamyl-tRNA(Gln) amidotransferase subunit A